VAVFDDLEETSPLLLVETGGCPVVENEQIGAQQCLEQFVV